MTVMAVVAHRRSRHAKRHFQGARNLVSTKIPSAALTVWDAAESYPRFVIAAAFLVCAALMAWWLPLGAAVGAGIAVFLLGRGVGLARAVTLRETADAAQRELVLARVHGEQVAADLARTLAELDSLRSASVRTVRLPAVEDGQVDR